jgi:hypothetical protein
MKTPQSVHLICKHTAKLNWRHLPDGSFESGEWIVSDELARVLVGKRLYLHGAQAEPAWHGGRITSWRHAAADPKRKIFTYIADEPFRISCLEGWAQEMAVVWEQ